MEFNKLILKKSYVFGLIFFSLLMGCSTVNHTSEDNDEKFFQDKKERQVKFFLNESCLPNNFLFDRKCKFTDEIESNQVEKLKSYHEVTYEDGIEIYATQFVRVNLDKNFPESLWSEKGKAIPLKSYMYDFQGRIERITINPNSNSNFFKWKLCSITYGDQVIEKDILTEQPSERYITTSHYKNNSLFKHIIYKGFRDNHKKINEYFIFSNDFWSKEAEQFVNKEWGMKIFNNKHERKSRGIWPLSKFVFRELFC